VPIPFRESVHMVRHAAMKVLGGRTNDANSDAAPPMAIIIIIFTLLHSMGFAR